MVTRHSFTFGQAKPVLVRAALAFVLLAASVGRGQDRSRDERAKPEAFGLPAGNERTSEPFVTRVFKVDGAGRILPSQPKRFPHTVKEGDRIGEDEMTRTHYGIDFSSRPSPGGPPVPLDFTAGVHGVVVKAGGGPWGTITVQIHDGTLVQYLHATVSHVKKGDVVGPDTPLGVTGRTGADEIHLHVQARDRFGNLVSPDLAIKSGQKKLLSEEKADSEAVEFDPDLEAPVRAEVVGGRVRSLPKPETKWVVEVIGEGGRIDEVLGEFYDYQSASYCAQSWSRERPDDLRLTREREVKVGGTRDAAGAAGKP